MDASLHVSHFSLFQLIDVIWVFCFRCIFDYSTENSSNAADLYETFRDYLRKYLENLHQVDRNLNDLHGPEIIQSYTKQCQKYQRSSKILHGMCSYLHRHYVKSEKDTGNSEIEEIYQVRRSYSIDLDSI